MTSGFVKEALCKGLEQMTSIRYRDRIISAAEYMTDKPHTWGSILCSAQRPVIFPVMEHRNNTTWALAKAFGGDESYGILARHLRPRADDHPRAAGRDLDLKLLPQPILNRIRSELCAGDVVLEAPSQISLFTYDNDTFCVYPSACDENAAAQQIRVRVKGVVNPSCTAWRMKSSASSPFM